ncbi:hypothetical protein [Pseudomonas putida]|uniref:Uncharacterized protein n=1 Tax=Pseudomonas putida TaxID=303 RepID=A0A8I1JI07_PSEPU|nr:hypothetical protein [Pseudomonas putida]MBI6883221.1 hypothetical protein [Pseudomonas putida]
MTPMEKTLAPAEADAEKAAERLRLHAVIRMGLYREVEAMAGAIGLEANLLAPVVLERGLKQYDKVTRYDVNPSALLARLSKKAEAYEDTSTTEWTIKMSRRLVMRIRLRAKEEELSAAQMMTCLLVYGIEDLENEEDPC